MVKNLIVFIFLSFITVHLSAQSFWTKTEESRIQLRSSENRSIIPVKYETFSLDIEGLKAYLAKAPMEFQEDRKSMELILDIPMPSGKTERFKVYESPVMENGLALKYPSIKSYKAYSLTEKAKFMRFDLSENGFHAAIFALDGEKYIDPYSSENTSDYIVYNTKDHLPEIYKGIQMCGTEDNVRPAVSHFRPDTRNAAEVELRVYRVAMACTGEWGIKRGTVEKCLADINTMMNRMNVIYEREMAMRFTLIADNDKLIHLNPATDPYDNSDEGKKIVGINTSKINALIPSSSYDIGHVLSVCFDIGGVAQGGSACQSNKGNGVTCNNDNNLSAIVTRVMAHEVGHQLDASHTWNICTSAADQRAPETAFEPGSGTTIMSYAGACGTDNVAGDNDDYFHVGSLDQMYNKTTQGGNAYACADKTLSGNHYPVITMPAKSYVIPISTPFELGASATDEDGDVMTYCWEQYDSGELVPLGSSSTSAPLFRSFKPSVTGDIRFFPKGANILSGNFADKTEVLPSNSRNLTFRFTVRDNHPGAGGVLWGEYNINSTTEAGPFKITYPEIDSKFQIGQEVNVTWNVANTDKAPVNCKFVNIYGSFNSALRNDDPNLVPLALNVPNDGSQLIYIPNKTSNFFRVVIKAADNIFLTSSRIPSKIESPTIPGIYFETQQNYVEICQPNEGKVDFTTSGLAGFTNDIYFEVISGLPEGTTAKFLTPNVAAGGNTTLVIRTLSVVGNQTGQITVRAVAPGVDTMYRDIIVNITGGNLSDIQTLQPANGSSGIPALPKFNWIKKVDAESYEIQLASNPGFAANDVVVTKTLTDSIYTSSVILEKASIYYWRVRAINKCGAGSWSEVKAFITEALSCKVYDSGAQSIGISASGTPTVEIPVQITNEGVASDVNVKSIKGEHSRLVDLVAYLVAPSGKESLLWSRKCGTQQNLNLGLDDQSPDFFQCPINTGRVYRPESLLSAFNGESIKGNWKVRVEDKQSGSGGKLTQFALEICSGVTLDQPYLVKNDTLKIYPGNKKTITDALLLAADNNNTAAELVFTLVETPKHGTIIYNGGAVSEGARFTQAEINTSSISYQAEVGTNGNDYFSFTVADGQGGWIAITKFNILRDESFINAITDINISQDVFVKPNPTSSDISIILSGAATHLSQYTVTDLAGRSLLKGVLNEGSTVVPLAELASGVYMVKLTDGRNVVTKKIVRL